GFCASKSRSVLARKNPLSFRTRAFALANSKKDRVLRKQKPQRAGTQKSLVRKDKGDRFSEQ
ncbi:hypothetical protein, partial [uncultured Treponema sp.]|uniref:hypothetical protein n=1 Tax=uncultured Treponema sp. TaxID=162155 RepID=UPI00261D4DFD